MGFVTPEFRRQTAVATAPHLFSLGGGNQFLEAPATAGKRLSRADRNPLDSWLRRREFLKARVLA